MLKKLWTEYEVEDFLTDSSFTNYHFRLNTKDELRWKEWLADHPEKKAIVKEARELLQTLSVTISDEEYREEFQKLKKAIDADQGKRGLQHVNRSTKRHGNPKTRLVRQFFLPVLLIVILGGYFFLHNTPVSSGKLVETVNRESSPLVITLSDSTIVTLAPQSILRYPVSFQQKERNVYLDGDASFHVKRNELAPFKVYSQNITAIVLGTIFNFKKSGDSITIELLQGRLNVQLNDNVPGRKLLSLYPDEKAVYVKHYNAFYKTNAARARVPIDLNFHQNSFEEIASRIKNAFGTTVINRSNKKAWRFTGEFKNTTAKDVVDNMCLVKGLSAEIRHDTIFIK